MRDEGCVCLLQWALPRLGLRWRGFRRVRSQVCKRIVRRLGELGLRGHDAYREWLATHPEEWSRLDQMCRITISRFFRDREVCAAIGREVLPRLAEMCREDGRGRLRCWSCGCASGEEPYTLNMIWELGVGHGNPGVELEVVATDADPHLLARARRGVYPEGSLRDLPVEWRAQGLVAEGELWRVVDRLRTGIEWCLQDIRREVPAGVFDLVLCRNLVFTYFDGPRQHQAMDRLAAALRPGGALVIGCHEDLPADSPAFEPWLAGLRVFRRAEPGR